MAPWTFNDPNFKMALRLVARWGSKHPDLSARLERAVFMLENIRPTRHPDRYEVTSSTGHILYTVRISRRERSSTCNCADHSRGNHCKHRLAVALYEKVTTGTCQ